jgi:hypothetical protein
MFCILQVFAFIAFSQKSRPYFEDSFTHYRGVIAGQYDEYAHIPERKHIFHFALTGLVR